MSPPSTWITVVPFLTLVLQCGSIHPMRKDDHGILPLKCSDLVPMPSGRRRCSCPPPAEFLLPRNCEAAVQMDLSKRWMAPDDDSRVDPADEHASSCDRNEIFKAGASHACVVQGLRLKGGGPAHHSNDAPQATSRDANNRIGAAALYAEAEKELEVNRRTAAHAALHAHAEVTTHLYETLDFFFFCNAMTRIREIFRACTLWRFSCVCFWE
jgi:hypothetical protein